MRLLLATLLLLSFPLPIRAADLSKHLPADATWIVGLEVPAFLQAPLVHDHLPALLKLHGPTAVAALLKDHLPHDANLAARLTPAFAEPDAALAVVRQRLQRLQIARTGNRAQSSLFVIAEGRFSAAELQAFVKIAAALLWPGCDIDTIRLANHDVLRLRLRGRAEVLYVALPEDGTVLATPNLVALVRILDQADRGRASPPAQLAEYAGKIDALRTPLWLVGAPKPTDGLAPCWGGLDFTGGLHGQLTFSARTQDEARELASDLREIQEEIVDSAKGLQRQNREGQSLVKSVQAIVIKSADRKVNMQLELPGDELKRVLSR